MNCKLFPQIFLSSVLQMLVDVSSNKLYILSQLPENNLIFVLQRFNRDSLFFHISKLFLSVQKQSPSMKSSYKTVYNLPSTFSKMFD